MAWIPSHLWKDFPAPVLSSISVFPSFQSFILAAAYLSFTQNLYICSPHTIYVFIYLFIYSSIIYVHFVGFFLFFVFLCFVLFCVAFFFFFFSNLSRGTEFSEYKGKCDHVCRLVTFQAAFIYTVT